jgi:hypothetical protein
MMQEVVIHGMRLARRRTPYKVKLSVVLQEVFMGISYDYLVLREVFLVNGGYFFVVFHGGHFHILPEFAVPPDATV